MVFKLIAIALFIASSWFNEIDGHGRLMEPVNRGSAWRKNYNTPIDYNDNQNYCGGFSIQYNANDGKCGPCGDNYADPRPRNNENGGKYGTGLIVRKYKVGQEIDLQVEITANHMGHFEFSLCPLNYTMDIENEECFDAHPIYLANGEREYPIKADPPSFYNIKAVLPDDVTCEHCVLRWHYRCGNNWGYCGNGTGQLGCGPQEIFRSCSDVAIL
ncbi:uncharacterized protein LOC131665223 [Phymastichus coffea]|uniref:uncharacterized protein LOC131665223 n=1 Tax=Phymastichus coffea TaxID=108790 RepID=UPI00273A7CE1|nr:uncharacterized protein LOC131665223 [Phymastichus coffea]